MRKNVPENYPDARGKAMDIPTINLHDLTMQPEVSTRRHGFSGQRMTVVPQPVLKRSASVAQLRSLRVTDAGFFPKASRHFVQREQGATTELLMVCVSGEGLVRVGSEKTLTVRAGDAVWLPSMQAHSYEAAPEFPWSIQWVHFDGFEASEWRKLVFGGDISCRVPTDRLGELAMDRIHAILEHGYSDLNLIEAATALRFSLGVLARLRQRPGATWSAHARVAASVEHLRSSWMHDHSLEEMAAQAGVSVSHYSAIFRKQTGFSPIDFLLRQRIQCAAFLLATTTNSITDIAAESGYEDPYYFSRCFRKVMGISPRSYRKQQPLRVQEEADSADRNAG